MSDWVDSTYGEVAPARRERSADHPTVSALLSVTAAEGVIDQAQSGRRDISAPDKSKYLVVRLGDVVYNTMRMWQGVSGYAALEGIASPAYTVVTPNPSVLDGRYLAHQMKRPENVAIYRALSQGLVSDTWSLKYQTLAKLPLAIPPLEEQRRIAEILDTIDETIQATQRVIAKLTLLRDGRRRSVMACHIGQYASSRFGDHFAMILGKMLSPAALRGSSRTPFLANRNVQWERFVLDDLDSMDFSDDEKVKYKIEPGDLLVCEGGEVGRAAVLET